MNERSFIEWAYVARLTPAARRALTEERRAQILAAAARVFAREGYERATVAEIAREAGVAAGSIYSYYKNKADLLVHVPRQFVHPAVQKLHAEALRSDAPPEEVLALAGRNLIEVVRQNADLVRTMMSSVPSMSRALRARYMEQVPFYVFGELEAYFRQQVAAGVFRADLNPVLAARMFPGLILPFLIMQEVVRVPDGAPADYDQVVHQAVSLFLGGAMAVPKGKR